MTKSILFVCLGNICRSPMAEAIMNQVISAAGTTSQWTVDSCGTAAYHLGEDPDDRAQATIRKHGATTTHKGRQLCKDDFYKFDYILGMDQENLRNIKSVAPSDAKSTIGLLGDYDPQGKRVIGDPYYGGVDGFEPVFQQCKRCCEAFYNNVS